MVVKGLDVRDPSQRGSSLGDIVREFYRFIEAGTTRDHVVLSPTEGYSPMRAPDFFLLYGAGSSDFRVRQSRLPFDRDVKSVIYHRGKIYVETTKVNFEELEDALRGHNAQIKGKSIFSQDEKIILTRTQNAGTFDKMDLRTLITMLPGFRSPDAALAVEVIDRLYNQGCFVYGPEEASNPKPIKPEMKQTMEMRQELQQIQVPKMLPIMEQTYTLARRINLSNVLKMNNQRLSQHIRAEAEKNPVIEITEKPIR